MTQTTAPQPPSADLRVRWDAVVLLVLAAAAAGLAITISFGFNVEYANTAASDLHVAARSFVDWWIGLVIVAMFAAGAIVAARRSRGRRAMTRLAVAIMVLTVIGIPVGAVLGAHEKYDRYAAHPSCTSGFNGGPAVPVLRAAQDRFVELDHPGPFSGGGWSGIDGCAMHVIVKRNVDVLSRYRETLPDNGWRIDRDGGALLSATRAGQGFEAGRARDGAWWVWIGPAGTPGLTQAELGQSDGQVRGPSR